MNKTISPRRQAAPVIPTPANRKNHGISGNRLMGACYLASLLLNILVWTGFTVLLRMRGKTPPLDPTRSVGRGMRISIYHPPPPPPKPITVNSPRRNRKGADHWMALSSHAAALPSPAQSAGDDREQAAASAHSSDSQDKRAPTPTPQGKSHSGKAAEGNRRAGTSAGQFEKGTRSDASLAAATELFAAYEQLAGGSGEAFRNASTAGSGSERDGARSGPHTGSQTGTAQTVTARFMLQSVSAGASDAADPGSHGDSSAPAVGQGFHGGSGGSEISSSYAARLMGVNSEQDAPGPRRADAAYLGASLHNASVARTDSTASADTSVDSNAADSGMLPQDESRLDQLAAEDAAQQVAAESGVRPASSPTTKNLDTPKRSMMYKIAPDQKIVLPKNLDSALPSFLQVIPGSKPLTPGQINELRKLLHEHNLQHLNGLTRDQLKKLLEARKDAERPTSDLNATDPEFDLSDKPAPAPRRDRPRSWKSSSPEEVALPQDLQNPFHLKPWDPAYRERYAPLARAAAEGGSVFTPGTPPVVPPHSPASATQIAVVPPDTTATPITPPVADESTPNTPGSGAGDTHAGTAGADQLPAATVQTGTTTSTGQTGSTAANDHPGAAILGSSQAGTDSNYSPAGAGSPGAGSPGATASSSDNSQSQPGSPSTTQRTGSQPGTGGAVQPGTGRPGSGVLGAAQATGSEATHTTGSEAPTATPGATQPGSSGAGTAPIGDGVLGTRQPGSTDSGQPAQGGSQSTGAQTTGPQPGSGVLGSGAGQPGAGQSGAGQPGAGQPGAGQPGAGQPGAGQPGAGQPGAGQPGAASSDGGNTGNGGGQPGGGAPAVGHTGSGVLGTGTGAPNVPSPPGGQGSVLGANAGGPGASGTTQAGAGVLGTGTGVPGSRQTSATASAGGVAQPGTGVLRSGVGQAAAGVLGGSAGQPGAADAGTGSAGSGVLGAGDGQPGAGAPGAGVFGAGTGAGQPAPGAAGTGQATGGAPGTAPAGTGAPEGVTGDGSPAGGDLGAGTDSDMSGAAFVDSEGVANDDAQSNDAGNSTETGFTPAEGVQPNMPVHNHELQKGIPGALVLPPLPPLGSETGKGLSPHPIRQSPRPAAPTPMAVLPAPPAVQPMPRVSYPAVIGVAAANEAQEQPRPAIETPEPVPPTLGIGSTSAQGTVAVLPAEGPRLELGAVADTVAGVGAASVTARAKAADPNLYVAQQVQAAAARRVPVSNLKRDLVKPVQVRGAAGKQSLEKQARDARAAEQPRGKKQPPNSQGIKEGSLNPLPPTPLPDSDSEIGDGSGLKGEYYLGRNFDQYEFTRADSNLDFVWATESSPSPSPKLPQGSDYSVRWTGKIEPRYSETYTLYAVADDGVRVWINHKLLVDDWTLHPMLEYSGKIKLEAGKQYDIRVDYFESNGGGAGVGVYWESPSQKKEFIPEDRLFYPLAGDKANLALDEKPHD